MNTYSNDKWIARRLEINIATTQLYVQLWYPIIILQIIIKLVIPFNGHKSFHCKAIDFTCIKCVTNICVYLCALVSAHAWCDGTLCREFYLLEGKSLLGLICYVYLPLCGYDLCMEKASRLVFLFTYQSCHIVYI